MEEFYKNNKKVYITRLVDSLKEAIALNAQQEVFITTEEELRELVKIYLELDNLLDFEEEIWNELIDNYNISRLI